jgi:hypothetical protein
MFRTLLQ